MIDAEEGKSGRPRNVGEPMSDGDARLTLRVLRRHREDNPISFSNMSKEIHKTVSAYLEGKDPLFPFDRTEVRPFVSKSSLNRALLDDVIPENAPMKAIHLWIMSIDSCKLEYEREHQREYLQSKEPQVLSVRKLFGHRADMQTVRISPWLGNYALYRPFHLDPKNKAQVNFLKIGADESDFDCTLTSFFPAPLNPETKLVGRGKFTPLGNDHAVALMAMNQEFFAGRPDEDTQVGTYTLHVSDPQRSTGIDGFGGILVASMGPIPSAWPIFAMRLPHDEEIQPHVLDREEYRALLPIIRKQLDRGGVYWDEQDSPKVLSRGYAKPQEP
jgi:hypothetical protein